MDYTQYGMYCSPFEQTANATFYFASAVHQAAANAALKAVNDAPIATMIIGQTGMGKTMLASHLLEQFHRDLRVTSICVGSAGLHSVSERLASGLLLEAPAATTQQRITQIAQRMKSEAGKSTRFIALIDDAHNLSAENILEIEKLILAARNQNALLALVLLGSLELERNLRDADAKTLIELLPSAVSLNPLEFGETETYIRHRLRAAGNAKANLFSAETLTAIANSANGVPRDINAACLAAMDNLANDTNQATTAKPAAHSAAAPMTPVNKVVSRQPVTEQMGAILENAPRQLAQMRTAVERLEQRAEAAVARTSERLAEVKDQSVRQMRDLPTSPIDTQRLIETTADADRMHRKLSEFCDRFAEVSTTCEERLSLLLSSLDAARQVHTKLERLGENVGELVDDAQQSASDERDRLKAMFDELQARREELTVLLDSTGKTHAVQIAETNERTQSELKTIKASVQDAQSEWTRLKDQIDTEANQSRELIARIGDQLADQKRRLDQIKEIEKRCAMRADATASTMDALTANVGRASTMTAELEKLTREIESGRQAADQATTMLRSILADAQDVQSQSSQTTTEARKAAATITQAKDELTQNIGDAQRVADRLSDLEGDAAKRIDAVIGAAEARITQFVEQAISRIEHSIATAHATHENVTRKTEAAVAQIAEGIEHSIATAHATQENVTRKTEVAVAQIAEGIEHIRTARRNAIESLEPVIAGASKGKSEIAEALRSAQATMEHNKSTAIESLHSVHATIEHKKSIAIESLDAANQQAIQIMQQHSHTMLGTIQKSGKTAINEFQQTCEQSTLESLSRFSAAGGRQMAQINTQGESVKQNLAEWVESASSDIESITNGATDSIRNTVQESEKTVELRIAKAASHSEQLSEQSDTANRRCQEVILATKALSEVLDQSRKCREAVDHLIRDVWSMSTTAETRTRELVSLSEQALSRNETLRDAIARSKAPTTQLSDMLIQADKTSNALATQAQSTQKASLEFTRSIENAKRVNGDLKSLSESGAAIRDSLDEQTVSLLSAIQTGENVVQSIASEAQTANQTTHKVQELMEQATDAQTRLVEVQRSLSGPLGVIRDAQSQADELNGICLSVKRVFSSVSQATLDANERIKAMQTLLANSQKAQDALQQWVTEAIHTQVRLSSAIKGAPSVQQSHAMPHIPDASAQPVPDILKPASDVASTRSARIANPRKSDADAPKQSQTQRLSPDQIRKMIADAQSKAREKELASLK